MGSSGPTSSPSWNPADEYIVQLVVSMTRGFSDTYLSIIYDYTVGTRIIFHVSMSLRSFLNKPELDMSVGSWCVCSVNLNFY